MISCKLLLCAQGVVRDADSGGISIFNIIEGMQAAGFPFFLQQMHIFALFVRSPEDEPNYEIRYRISIGETELLTTPLAINFREKLRNRSIVRIQGIVIPHPGTLMVSAQLDENILGQYEMMFEQIEQPRVEAHQDPAGTESGA